MQPTASKKTLRIAAITLMVGLAPFVSTANDNVKKGKVTTEAPAGEISATSASSPKEVGNQVREALGTSVAPNKKLTLVFNGKPGSAEDHAAKSASTVKTSAKASRPLGMLAAPMPAVTGQSVAKSAKDQEQGNHEIHWSYEGEGAPKAWGKLKPEFSMCALGKRQSPINIIDGTTLHGPAEPIQFNYSPSNAVVVNNGHTIQVDVQGNNSITVRGSTYRLLQFHFHTPSEEQIDFKHFPMVAHLVHKNEEGQLAVIALLMDIGTMNPVIDKVWTYMPLETNDRVRMPRESINLNELLPTDQRYYQFMGSLTTPPCSEGVLWMVMKQPIQISKNQHKIFTQLYAFNARPVQPLNGRTIREAQ